VSKSALPGQPNRIAMLVNRPGGQTEAEAVAAATANLETIRDSTLQQLDEMVRQILHIGLALKIPPDPAEVQALYTLSNTIVGVAGVFGLAGLSAVAYSLCELIDRLRDSRTWNAQSVQVHLDSLLLMQGGGPGKQEELQVQQALRRLVDRVPTAAR